jgi:uncharacterized membrane protein
MHSLKTYLVTGLLVWIPLTITFLVLRVIVSLVDQTLLLIPRPFRPETLLGFNIPGLGIVLALVVLVLTGLIVANLLGRRIISTWERQLGRVPVIGAIYRGSKQVTETLLAPDSKSFRKVVLIRWPHRDSRALAFVTGSTLGEVQDRITENVVCVFLPTTPNPTSGFILMVPRDDIIELEMTVDEAFRMIVSLGVVVPEWPRPPAAPGPGPIEPRPATVSGTAAGPRAGA